MGRVRPAIIWLAVSVFPLAGIAFAYHRGSLAGVEEQGRVSSARALLSQLEQAIALYRADYDVYPKSLDALKWRPGSGCGRHCYSPVRENGQIAHLLVDPWGRNFMFRLLPPPSVKGRPVYQLYSIGPNGIDEGGGGDDVASD